MFTRIILLLAPWTQIAALHIHAWTAYAVCVHLWLFLKGEKQKKYKYFVNVLRYLHLSIYCSENFYFYYLHLQMNAKYFHVLIFYYYINIALIYIA